MARGMFFVISPIFLTCIKATWNISVPVTLEWKPRAMELVYGTPSVTWDVFFASQSQQLYTIVDSLYSIERSSSAKCRQVFSFNNLSF